VLATVGVPADAVDENVLALGNAWLGRGGRDLSLLKIDFMLPANGVDMVVGSKSFGVAGMDPQPKAPPNDAERCDPHCSYSSSTHQHYSSPQQTYSANSSAATLPHNLPAAPKPLPMLLRPHARFADCMVLLAIVKVVVLVVLASGVKVVLELGFEDGAVAVGPGKGVVPWGT